MNKSPQLVQHVQHNKQVMLYFSKPNGNACPVPTASLLNSRYIQLLGLIVLPTVVLVFGELCQFREFREFEPSISSIPSIWDAKGGKCATFWGNVASSCENLTAFLLERSKHCRALCGVLRSFVDIWSVCRYLGGKLTESVSKWHFWRLSAVSMLRAIVAFLIELFCREKVRRVLINLKYFK